MTSFKCGTSPGITNLCFGNSSCEIVNNEEVCINCPVGFKRDFTYGHFENCNLPILFVPALFGVCTIPLLFIFSNAIFDSVKLQAETKNILLTFGFTYIFQFFWLLSLMLEDGQYVATIIFLTLWGLSLNACGAQTIVIIVRPVYFVARKQQHFFKFKNSVRIIQGINLLVVLGLSATTQYYSIRDIKIYNMMFAISVAWMGVLAIVPSTAVYLESRRLKKLITSIGNNNNFQNRIDPSVKRLDVFARTLIIQGIPLFFTTAGYAVTVLMIGSFPYQFALVGVIHVSQIFVYPGFRMFLGVSISNRRKSKSDSVALGSPLKTERKIIMRAEAE